MGDKQVSVINPLATTSGERRAEFAKRSKPYDEITVPFELRANRESEGWTFVRENKASVRLRRPKGFEEVLENRFWNVLYRFGYEELNLGRNFKICITEDGKPLKQIDVFARDAETVVVAECKACSTLQRRSMQKDLGEFAALQKPIANALRKHYGVDFKPKILWFFVTDRIRWSPNDLVRAEEFNIHVVQAREMLYFEEIGKKLGKAAKFQFHAEYLQNQKVPALTGRAVPAIKTKIGGQRAYVFSARPVDILRIAFVNHRDLRDPEGAPSYQRLVNPSRLKAIGQFLDNGGFFPNTILLNFRRSPHFNRQASDELSDVQFGQLILPDRYKSCWVVDGQHRLYGTTLASEETSQPTLFFIAFDGLETKSEAEIFITINDKQTRVPKKLLAELDGDVKWNSDDIRERLSAIASRAVDLVNSAGGGVFEGKVVTPGVAGSADQPLTLPNFQQAILQARLLGNLSQRSEDFLPGPSWDGSSEESLFRLVELLETYFAGIESSNPERWERGKAGYLCSNFGVSGHIRLIGELVRHLEAKERIHAIDLDVDELVSQLQPYLEPILQFIREQNDEGFEAKFKVPFGSGGPPRYFFALVELVRRVDETFEPEGFEEFIQTISDEVSQRADRDVKWLQTVVPAYIIAGLHNLYGSKFFEKGVPPQIQLDCQRKRIDDDPDDQLPIETYLDWIHLKKIADQKEHRGEFPALSIPLPGERAGKAFYTEWFDRINEIRRISAHPAGRFYRQEDIDTLDAIMKSIREKLPADLQL